MGCTGIEESPELIVMPNRAEERDDSQVLPDPSAEPRPRSVVRDPVCRREVDSGGASYGVDYRGVWYYLCSLTCKRKFEDSPPRYVGLLR
jgi:YHS domain-containing protein